MHAKSPAILQGSLPFVRPRDSPSPLISALDASVVLRIILVLRIRRITFAHGLSARLDRGSGSRFRCTTASHKKKRRQARSKNSHRSFLHSAVACPRPESHNGKREPHATLADAVERKRPGRKRVRASKECGER